MMLLSVLALLIMILNPQHLWASQPPKARRRRQAKAVHAICSDSSLRRPLLEGARLDAGSRRAKKPWIAGKIWRNIQQKGFHCFFSQENQETSRKHPFFPMDCWWNTDFPMKEWANNWTCSLKPTDWNWQRKKKNIPSKVRITTINMIFHDFKFKHQTQGLD